jgi:predicted nuclease of predicted toxin-antitoxin system
VSGRFPLFTDENVDGPVIRGLRQRGWDVQHASEEVGEKTKDLPLLEQATEIGRVFVSTDKDMLPIAKQWAREGRAFRMIWWEQKRTQRILLQSVVDASTRSRLRRLPSAIPSVSSSCRSRSAPLLRPSPRSHPAARGRPEPRPCGTSPGDS